MMNFIYMIIAFVLVVGDMGCVGGIVGGLWAIVEHITKKDSKQMHKLGNVVSFLASAWWVYAFASAMYVNYLYDNNGVLIAKLVAAPYIIFILGIIILKYINN